MSGPLHPPPTDFAEMAGHVLPDLRQGRAGGAEELFKRDDGLARQAAGHNGGEPGEVGIHVETHAVERHPAFEPDADGRQFAGPGPGAREFGSAIGRDAKIPGGADGDFFQVVQVAVRIGLLLAQPDNWVHHELAGSVPGDVPAARRTVKIDPPLFQIGARQQDMTIPGAHAERNDGGMLEEQNRVGDGPGDAGIDQRRLQAHPVGVRKRRFDCDGPGGHGRIKYRRFGPVKGASNICFAPARLCVTFFAV